jgi:RNA polymerase sigma factor (sigma-70 family)
MPVVAGDISERGDMGRQGSLQPGGPVVRCTGVESDADVYIKYRDGLLRYATSLVGSGQAEDVVSTVVLRTMSRRSLADLENPHAYLMKGVLNESRSVWRRVATEPLSEVDSRHLPGEVVETLDALWRLPVRQRAAAFLFYWEACSVAEIAGLMDVRPGTVKRYLYNARQRLKRSLR